MDNKTNIPYKMIALDLDGTLTNHEKVVTPKTREALLRAQERGAVIVLASGRPTYGIEPVAECLELESRGGYILSYNGGKIVDCKTREELYSKFLPADVLEAHPTKLLMTGDPAKMIVAEEELSRLVGNRMDVFRSAPFFIELVPQGIDKAQSLLRLLGKLNLSQQDLMAFGDGYNDLSMLKLAAMGVAMENAAPEVRAEADWVTLSNENDGVAHALEQWNML